MRPGGFLSSASSFAFRCSTGKFRRSLPLSWSRSGQPERPAKTATNPLLKLSNLLHRHYAAILSLRHSLPCAGRGQNCFGRHMAFSPRLSPRDSVVDFRIDFGIQPLQMELLTVKIEKPAAINFVLGQTHFIKTVEDIHETLVAAVPGIQFGLAFCEASGKCLVRWSGTDAVMIKLAQENAQAVAAGHSFFIFFGEGFYPINVLNALKNVAEVCGIYCATANPVEVIIAATEQGRAILGVVDGTPPKAL